MKLGKIILFGKVGNNFLLNFMNNYLTGKNVLVTGATGLIGGHLVEALTAQGAKVFITWRSVNPLSYFAEKNLTEQIVSAGCDIKDYDRVVDIISKYEIEYIFHLAAQPIVSTALLNPRETFATNVMGTLHILEATRHCPRVKGVVVASSDKAYGKQSDNATEYTPMAGDHPYDVSKSCADLIARAYAKTYNLPVAVSRFGNIYGPGDLNFNRIIPAIMKAIIFKETLEIRSDGRFIRDYIYVKDVVNGYLLLMEKMQQIKGEAFNFSTGDNFSVLDLLKHISELTGQACQYNIVNNQVNEIPKQSLNYDKATYVLGWRPQRAFESGMMETFAWYQQYFKKIAPR